MQKNGRKILALLIVVLMMASLLPVSAMAADAEPAPAPEVTETDVPTEAQTATETDAPTEAQTVTETDALTETPTLTETPAADEVPAAVKAFLDAVAAIVIPEEINEETGPVLNGQIGAAQAAYEALSEEELAREDVQAAVVLMQEAMDALTGGAQTQALIKGESFTVNVVKVVNGVAVDTKQLTKTCLQSTGHSGYVHSTNLRDLANSSGFSGYKGYNWSQYTTVPSTYTSGLTPNSNYASVHYNITGQEPYKAVETLFLFFEDTYSYTVTHVYRTNGTEDGRTSGTVPNVASGTKVSASSIAKVTTYQGNTYTYTSATPTSATITGNGTTFTLYYDRTIQTAPDKPTENQVEALLRSAVKIDCTNTTVVHADKTYGLISGTYTIGTVQGSASTGYTCTVTVNSPDAYVAQYNTDIGTEHTLAPASQGAKAITLKYQNNAWTVAAGVPITYTVVCNAMPTVAGYSTVNITKKFAGDITSAPNGFALDYSYTNLETNQPVSGTVPLSGSGDTLSGSIQVPYYNNVATGATTKLTLTEVNAEVSGYTLTIGSDVGKVDQVENTIQYSVAATNMSTINRTITNTYTKNPTPPTPAKWDQLTITKTSDPAAGSTVKPGDIVTYTVVVTNNTGKDLINVTVSEKLDSNLQFRMSEYDGDYNRETGVWMIPTLANGESKSLTIKAAVIDGVADGTVIANTAAITGAEAGDDDKLPDGTRPSASADVTVSNPQVEEVPVYVVIYRNGDVSKAYKSVYYGKAEKGTAFDLSQLDIADYYVKDKAAAGFEFEGWYNDGGWNNYKAGNPNNKLGETITINGWTNIICMVWDQYKVNYHVDGQIVKTDLITERTRGDYVLHQAEEREGYTFDGWYEKEADIGNSAKKAKTPLLLKKYELYGAYSANSYTIVYHGNGGVLSADPNKDQTSSNWKYDQEVTLKNSKTFAREDWVFQGWATSAEGEAQYAGSQKGVFNFTAEKDGQFHLYAVWTPALTPVEPVAAAYKVEHYVEQADGSYALKDTDMLTGQIGALVTGEARDYAYHNLDTKHPGAVASGTVVLPSTVEGQEPQILTLKLYYSFNQLTLRYDTKGGDGSFDPETKKVGDSGTAEFAVSNTVPTLDGYIFKGWMASDGKIYQPGASLTLSADETLSALWEKIPTKVFTLRYDANGGRKAPASQSAETTADSVQMYVSESKPTRHGYFFQGWSTTKNGHVQYRPGQVITLTGDVTLYAVWARPTDSPRTGDTSNIGLWAALASISVIAMGAAVVIVRKKTRKE